MTRYLIHRLFALIPVLAVVVTIVFLLIHPISSEAVGTMLGPGATLIQVEAI